MRQQTDLSFCTVICHYFDWVIFFLRKCHYSDYGLFLKKTPALARQPVGTFSLSVHYLSNAGVTWADVGNEDSHAPSQPYPIMMCIWATQIQNINKISKEFTDDLISITYLLGTIYLDRYNILLDKVCKSNWFLYCGIFTFSFSNTLFKKKALESYRLSS